jgi:hypothetical protein
MKIARDGHHAPHHHHHTRTGITEVHLDVNRVERYNDAKQASAESVVKEFIKILNVKKFVGIVRKKVQKRRESQTFH